MTMQEESAALEEVLAHKSEDWQKELDAIEAEIRGLDDILADKESKTDRSENATFQIAKDTRDLKMASYDVIYKKLQKYAAHKDTYVHTGFITIGSTVEVNPVAIKGGKFLDDRAHRVIKLVEEGLSDAEKRLVGVDSALGTALLGHKVGDSVTIKTRKGMITYKIERMY